MSRGQTLSVCSRWSQPAPPKGELFVVWRQAEQNLPLRGRWHRAAMTERVLSVPPALFLSGLALSVTFGDTSPKGRGLGKEMKFAWTAKGSPFGRAVKADRH